MTEVRFFSGLYGVSDEQFLSTASYLLVDRKPDALAEVWALTGDLEMKPADMSVRSQAWPRSDGHSPLLKVELLRRGSVAELVFLVIGSNEVLNNGTRLPKSDSSIRVFNGRGTTIGVKLLKLGSLEVFKLPELGVIRNTKLLHHEGHFPWVGALQARSMDVISSLERCKAYSSVAMKGNGLERHG